MMKAGATGRLSDVLQTQRTHWRICRILSTGEPFLPFPVPRSPLGRRSGGKTPGIFL